MSAAIERNTKMVEFVVSHLMDLGHKKATSSALGDQDLGSDEVTPTLTRNRRKFRAPTKKPVHKDPDELSCQVCLSHDRA